MSLFTEQFTVVVKSDLQRPEFLQSPYSRASSHVSLLSSYAPMAAIPLGTGLLFIENAIISHASDEHDIFFAR